MRRRKVVKTKIYNVDWYRGDWCYRTTTGCKWEDVKDCKRAAKLMGEKIKYELDHVREDVYIL